MQSRVERRPWHYITCFARGLCDFDLAHGRRQGDAEGGERAAGGGTRRRAQQEALAVLFDLRFGQRVQVGDDLWPG